MPKQKNSLKYKLSLWTTDKNKDIFEVKSERQIFCKVCAKLFVCEKKGHIHQHEVSSVHRDGMKTPFRQTLLTQSMPDSSNKEFNYELCQVLLAANIPWNKIQNTEFNNFLKKYCGRKIPDESTLRKNYLPQCYKDTIDRIRAELNPFNIWVSVDETTDSLGRYIANCIVGKLSDEEAGKSYLLATKQLDRTNHATVARFIHESLEILWPNSVVAEKFRLFVSDGAPYMVKCGTHLKVFYPQIVHVTCLAHAINLVAEKIRSHYEDVDTLISNVKKIFVKAPLRVEVYREKLQNLPLPPQPVLTRWGTWLEAAIFYNEHFDSIKDVIMSFDENSSQAIKKAKQVMEKKETKSALMYIASHFKILKESIVKLETFGLPLTTSMDIIEDVSNSLKNAPGVVAASVFKKFEDLLKKNVGYNYFSNLVKVFKGEDIDKNYNFNADDIMYKFAPITSCDVERSFSKYKSILAENRQSFTVKNLEEYLVCNVNM